MSLVLQENSLKCGIGVLILILWFVKTTPKNKPPYLPWQKRAGCSDVGAKEAWDVESAVDYLKTRPIRRGLEAAVGVGSAGVVLPQWQQDDGG